MEDDAHQPHELDSQFRVMKTYLKASDRLWDLLEAQRIDRMTRSLTKWFENEPPDKGDPKKVSFRVLR